MAYEAMSDRPQVYRVLLEARSEGVYINVFDSENALEPYIDRLAPTLQGAMLGCKEEFGIQEAEWREVPDESWHAPA
jgi:hypothetical protein